MIPFYDPMSSYEHNYAHGPFGDFREPCDLGRAEPSQDFLGLPVVRPFGIPAGPLLNAKFCAAAFAHGYDINAYKTVRTRAHGVHPFPNTLAVHVGPELGLDDAAAGVLADASFGPSPSITNSFGVPSKDPDEWQADMAAAVGAAGPGQILVGSFQGTKPDADVSDRRAAYVADHATAARLVVETGAPVLEMNTSCPNEGTANLLCFDADAVVDIASAVKEAVGDVPLLLKIAYFADEDALVDLVTRTHRIVQGYSAINTIPARLLNAHGGPALVGEGREHGGVCGAAIKWAGLEMVARLARLREDMGADFAIVGVGGVMNADDYASMRHAGADAVMSATGAMFRPELSREIRALGTV